MAKIPFPLFESFDRFHELHHHNFSKELPAVLEFLGSFPDKLKALEGYEAVRSFLRSYEGNAATFNSYRTHVERMLLWSLMVCQKPLLELTRQDGERFLEFCIKPPSDWIGPVVKARFQRNGGRQAKDTDTYTANPKWRPFFSTIKKPDLKLAKEQQREPEAKPYEMKQDTIAQIFAVCGSFYQFLADEGLSTNANPIRTIKQKSKYKQRVVSTAGVKSLTPLQWSYVLDTAKILADADPVIDTSDIDDPNSDEGQLEIQKRKDTIKTRNERTLFIVATIFSMYLRISDLVGRDNWEPRMNSFLKDAKGNWWFYVTGKGNKAAKISVKEEYINVWMARYRRHLKMTPTPSSSDTSPLLSSLRGRAGLSEGHVRSLVQAVFDKALARMKADGFSDDDIQNLRAASLHWLRHTSATFDAKIRDMKDLQADLRHESMATTTDTYYNSLDDERHRSNKDLSIEDR